MSDPKIDWITIPPGTFTLGSPISEPCRGMNSETQVEVTLTRSFVIAKTEITREQWTALGFPDPAIGNGDSKAPVNIVNWFDALAYCNRLSEFEGLETCYDLSNCKGSAGSGCPNPDNLPIDYVYCDAESGAFSCTGLVRRFESMYDCPGYRLPTTAEWEYAARAGTITATYLGDLSTDNTSGCVSDPAVDPIAWHCGVTSNPEIVAQKQPNDFGLYDILGNVREWIDYVYTGWDLEWGEGMDGPLTDPMGAEESTDVRRGLRGGYFFVEPCHCRSAQDIPREPDERFAFVGFRPVRTIFNEN